MSDTYYQEWIKALDRIEELELLVKLLKEKLETRDGPR